MREQSVIGLPHLMWNAVIAQAKKKIELSKQRCTQVSIALERARQAHWKRSFRIQRVILEDLLKCELKPEIQSMVHLSLAELEMERGGYDRAWNHLCSVGPTPIRDEVEWLRASVAFKRKDWSQVFKSLEHIDRRSFHYHEAKIMKAETYYQMQLESVALKALTEVIETYPEYPHLDRLYYERGEVLAQMGKFQKAVDNDDALIFRWPWKPMAERAKQRLEQWSREGYEPRERSWRERYERAKLLSKNKHWDLAEEAFEVLYREVRTSEGHGEWEHRVSYHWALNAYHRSDYLTAIERLSALAKEADHGHMEGLSRYRIYRYLILSHAQLGDFDRALEALKRRDRALEEGKRLENLAQFYEANGRYARALYYWKQVWGKDLPKTWHAAFLLYLAKDYVKAKKIFKELAAHSRYWVRYRYWLGRIAMKEGKWNEALEIFDAIKSQAPLDYYAYQSANRMEEIEYFQHTGIWPQSAGRIEWEGFGEKFGPQSGKVHWDWGDLDAYDHAPDVKGGLERAMLRYEHLFPRLRRAWYKYQMGWQYSTRLELRDIALEYLSLRKIWRRRGGLPSNENPWPLEISWDKHYIDNRVSPQGYWGVDLSRAEDRYPIPEDKAHKRRWARRQRNIIREGEPLWRALKSAFKEGGEYHMVRRMALDRPQFLKTSPLEGAFREDWKEAFPRAYPEQVLSQCERFELNPYFLWALMHIESTYNPDSISRADARGLLQVIPRTGIKVASAMGIEDYGPHDLLEEDHSIRFGSWYVAQVMHKFKDQALLAAAGYNGGPHNVARWLTMRGRVLEMDEFIETIPFDQARRYAKKVVRYMGLYRRIYEGDASLYIGNGLDPEFKKYPNY